jgi:hypothetical protein
MLQDYTVKTEEFFAQHLEKIISRLSGRRMAENKRLHFRGKFFLKKFDKFLYQLDTTQSELFFPKILKTEEFSTNLGEKYFSGRIYLKKRSR